jgi:hypothetical protein
MVTSKLIGRNVIAIYWIYTTLGTKISCPNLEVETLTRHWAYYSCSIGHTNFSWLVLATYPSFLLSKNQWIMSFDPKIIWWIHIKIHKYKRWWYTTLGCPTINGVTSCCQLGCWLINVQLLTKPGCGQGCCIGTPTCIASVHSTIRCREIMSTYFIDCFNLSSTKGQFLRSSCPTYWQYAHDNAISTIGCMLGTTILHWMNDCLIVPITSTFSQTFWLSGRACWTTIGIVTTST